jgi:hypothetical protein
MEEPFHYPPELLQLLIDTIPRLSKGKKDVVLFFRGAGAPESLLRPWDRKIATEPDSLSKFDIARDILTKLNEGGDATIRPRREVLKRVVEFEDFSTCWPNEVLKAKGLISEIQRVVNVKDSFTRMRIEREGELRKHRETREAEARLKAQEKQALVDIRTRLAKLFSSADPHGRGKALEGVLNDLFKVSGILVREAFARTGVAGEGVIEQIDGVIELEGHIYLVEMKWLATPAGAGDLSSHLVRVYGRGAARGIFISASDYSPGAVSACVDALSQKVVVLCSLAEICWLLENEKQMGSFLQKKVQAAILDKQPNASVLSML